MLDSEHKPVIGGAASVDKMGIDKVKRSMLIQGGSAAPIKLKLSGSSGVGGQMKFKASQIAFKSTETKVIKKE